MDSALVQERVRKYWDGGPCDSGLSSSDPSSRRYFLDIEHERYTLQPHILDHVLAKVDWNGKRVLEIGSGVGTDGRRIIRMGGDYTSINIDGASTETTARALRAFSLPGVVQQGDATALEFRDGAFDAVYSFGVLHHIPESERAIAEIHRVLRPGGELLVMLYNRSSINYVVEIMFLRKLGLRILSLPGAISLLAGLGLPREKLERHRELARKPMTGEEWLSRNTDGPDNPYSKVYGAREAEELLRGFRIEANEVHFFDHRHWGVFGRLLPATWREQLGRRWGWHRVVYATKD